MQRCLIAYQGLDYQELGERVASQDCVLNSPAIFLSSGINCSDELKSALIIINIIEYSTKSICLLQIVSFKR